MKSAKVSKGGKKKSLVKASSGLAVKVNGKEVSRAMLPGRGILTFHVSVQRDARGAEAAVRIHGGELTGTDVESNVFMRWAEVPLTIGDRVELRFVEGGPSRPSPKAFLVDGLPTRAGNERRLRSLRREVLALEAELGTSRPRPAKPRG